MDGPSDFHPLRSDDPRQLGGYRMFARLGEGGMGTVFLAKDHSGRAVAVKVIRPDLSCDPDFRERFRGEVQRAREVPPFCTAEILDADPLHETPYLVEEYIDGPSLAEVIAERGPLTGGSLHSVAIGVVTALAAIHDAGVIHRDLKPTNVLFALGTPKVIDFGLAKAFDTTTRHTGPGQIFGSIDYMAPERFGPDPGPVTGAADIFSWGVVVTFAATGATPFAADDPITTATRICNDERDLRALPEPLRHLVTAALDKDPARRPTARQLLEYLLKAEAAGNAAVRSGLRRRPELRRAAHALRHTIAGKRAPGPTPAAGRAVARQRGPARRRRWQATTAAALAIIGATVVGPLAHRTPNAPRGDQPTVSDSGIDEVLGRPEQERASRGDSRNNCAYQGSIPITRRSTTGFSCTDPADGSPNQTITTQIQLTNSHACAAVWTHVTATTAYKVTLCRNHMSLATVSGRSTRIVGSADIDPPLAARQWITLAIRAKGPILTVSLGDDMPALTRRAASPPPHGRVILGLSDDNDTGDPDQIQITFADVKIQRT
jgi:protein kinase-like protein